MCINKSLNENYAIMSAMICILKLRHPEIYKHLCQSKVTYQEICTALCIEEWRDHEQSTDRSRMSLKAESAWRILFGMPMNSNFPSVMLMYSNRHDASCDMFEICNTIDCYNLVGVR